MRWLSEENLRGIEEKTGKIWEINCCTKGSQKIENVNEEKEKGENR